MTDYQIKTENQINQIFELIRRDIEQGIQFSRDRESKAWFSNMRDCMHSLQRTCNVYFQELRREDITSLPDIQEAPKGGKPN